MHMADALLSPVVGGALWVASAGLIGYSAKKIASEHDEAKTPLMGILGAFIFAAQMINFSIPGTGSSGHLGGGLLLTAMLGPYRAFITLASVFVIQCLFFADGGLLALGCNIFNLAFFPAFIAYPFIFKPIAGALRNSGHLFAAGLTAAVVGLQLGAFAVVLETTLSGVSDLPFTTFLLFMQPIHLGIGIVEGLVTWGVLTFIARTQPALLEVSNQHNVPRFILITFVTATVLIGGIAAWFASSDPDGLEWSIGKVTGTEELEHSEKGLHAFLARLQEKLAFLPDYSFRSSVKAPVKENTGPISAGTSTAGIIGSLIVLLLAVSVGFILRRKRSPPQTGCQ
jgi:cobalt/nickel transport system permease protein